MNTEEITQFITMLAGIGATLSPIVFWVMEAMVKPFVKDGRALPFYAVIIGGVLGGLIPTILPALGFSAIPVIGSIAAGIVGGAIASKTYDQARKDEDEDDK